MKKINWGIIGCGDVTEIKSGPAFNKVPNSALVAVMRRDGAKAEDYARRHGVPRWYDDAAKLINDPEVNAIYVATPPSSHEEYAFAAMNAGKPVYVEKPMADSYAAACRMADAVARMGAAGGDSGKIAPDDRIKLVVAHYRREQPRFLKIRQLIREKAIGEPLLARLELTKPPLTEDELTDPKMAWRVDPAIAGGGLFHDLATHQLDLMYYFFGPVRKVSGIAVNQGGLYAADDMVAGNLLFESGVAFSGSWCFSADAALTKDHCEILGTKGKLSFTIFSTNTIDVTVGGKTETISFDEIAHAQQPMIGAVVSYFLGERGNPCTAREGAEIMRVMETFTRY